MRGGGVCDTRICISKKKKRGKSEQDRPSGWKLKLVLGVYVDRDLSSNDYTSLAYNIFDALTSIKWL